MANYKIIGADGVERGPVSLEQVRTWISEQRLKPESKVQVEGATDWVTLGSLPEFADTLKAVPPPVVGNLPPLKKRTSLMAVLSLVFGVLGILACITSPVALILGIIALIKISKNKGELGGFGLALAGVIVGAIGLLLTPIMLAMLLPALAAAKIKADTITCLNHEHELMLAVKVYENGHNNQMPPADQWCDVILADPGHVLVGSTNVFKCPDADPASRCSYAFNSKLSGMNAGQISPDTVVLFESDGGWNASGGPEQMISVPRHRRIYCVAFADGHMESVTAARVSSLRWDP